LTDSKAVERAVHQFLPDTDVLGTAAHDWNSDPFSRGGWPAYPPRTLSRVASGLQRPEGRLSFATADIATRWIGWLDGALESGARAAGEALACLEGSPREVGG
jgi:monoamine oxidase